MYEIINNNIVRGGRLPHGMVTIRPNRILALHVNFRKKFIDGKYNNEEKLFCVLLYSKELNKFAFRFTQNESEPGAIMVAGSASFYEKHVYIGNFLKQYDTNIENYIGRYEVKVEEISVGECPAETYCVINLNKKIEI